MKANSKRKVFGDAVDLLMGDMEEVFTEVKFLSKCLSCLDVSVALRFTKT